MKIEDIKKSVLLIDGDIFFDQSIKNLNWFNIGGKTKIFFKPNSLKSLIEYLKLYALRGKLFILISKLEKLEVCFIFTIWKFDFLSLPYV